MKRLEISRHTVRCGNERKREKMKFSSILAFTVVFITSLVIGDTDSGIIERVWVYTPHKTSPTCDGEVLGNYTAFKLTGNGDTTYAFNSEGTGGKTTLSFLLTAFTTGQSVTVGFSGVINNCSDRIKVEYITDLDS